MHICWLCDRRKNASGDCLLDFFFNSERILNYEVQSLLTAHFLSLFEILEIKVTEMTNVLFLSFLCRSVH